MVPQGSVQTLSSPVDGNPEPNISWYKGSESSGRPIFSEEKLESRESGCYNCVSNSLRLSVRITPCLYMVYLTIIPRVLFRSSGPISLG